MKNLTFIILIFCFFFSACKAKKNEETSSNKTVNKISKQFIKQKSNSDEVKKISSNQNDIAPVAVNQLNQSVSAQQLGQTVQSEELESWKKEV